VWLETSRAIRTTNLVERGIHISLGTFDAGFTTGLIELFGQPNTQSEEMMAYETGYRYQAGRKFWLDLATFYNAYQNLSTTIQGAPFFTTGPGPSQFVAPSYFSNAMKGETYGAELSTHYRVSRNLTFRGAYSLLRMQLHRESGIGSIVENPEGQSPRHQVNFESQVNLPKSFEFTSHAYFVGSLPNYQIPRYTRIDTNITWKGIEGVELSLIGQNLQGSHLEFGDTPAASNMIPRSIFGKVQWKF
jgi:iron complex outermembrane receptor protein